LHLHVTENPNGTEFIVDFFTSNIAKKKKKTNQNQNRKWQITTSIDLEMLLGEQSTFMIITYKQKNTGDTKYFHKNLGKSRNKLMENIITMNIPNVTLKNKKFRPKIGIFFSK
jgi:hypothetical protein